MTKKLLSDFQTTDCAPAAPPVLDPGLPCPTCVPNPNYVLETDWWNMTEGWLDEFTCEYKFNFNVKLFDKTQALWVDRYSDEWKAKRNPYAIEWVVRRLLKQYDKLRNDETTESLIRVAIVEEEYVHPEYDTETLLITLPALNLDVIPEQPLDEDELAEGL